MERYRRTRRAESERKPPSIEDRLQTSEARVLTQASTIFGKRIQALFVLEDRLQRQRRPLPVQPVPNPEVLALQKMISSILRETASALRRDSSKTDWLAGAPRAGHVLVADLIGIYAEIRCLEIRDLRVGDTTSKRGSLSAFLFAVCEPTYWGGDMDGLGERNLRRIASDYLDSFRSIWPKPSKKARA